LPTHNGERVVLLPGDGIGPEVAEQARRVLELLVPEIEIEERLIGAAAIRATGEPFPAETRDACLRATAVLKGPVGDPEFDAADVRPEQGLLALRAALDTFANLRPAVAEGVDLLIVRELVGGLYFGARGVREDGTVFDTCEYHPRQIERIVRRAFRLAQPRRGHLTSVDKANVLDTSRLWRRIVDSAAPDYPEVTVEHMLVDNAAMQLATDPEQFDVLVTENMFGDILSDLAAAVTGGLGLAPSASLSDGGPGIFEPVHGSAPDIAGRGIANPTAMLRSTALLLEHGLGRLEEANALTRAVDVALASTPTADMGGAATTAELGAAIREQLAVDCLVASPYRDGDAARA
jgi:3-isopropylmalate dehydrogenase